MNINISGLLNIAFGGIVFLAASPESHGAAIASADSFGSGANSFTIEFVEIGNPGNTDDAGAGGGASSTPHGGLSYIYRMGVTEVPQDWITKATNLGLSNVTAGPWTGDKPATNMTWYEAAAFVNFLNTSTGHHVAYQINPGVTALTLWSTAEAWQVDGQNFYRHKDAYYFLPSEDEWYKAAYHKNDGVTANYWDYATASNTIPTAVTSGITPGTAVFNQDGPAAVDNSGGLGAYGTRGQTGNVFELQESALLPPNDDPSEQRVVRGGNYIGSEPFYQNSAVRQNLNVAFATATTVGFRVASVPEPSAAMLMIGSGVIWIARRRRASLLPLARSVSLTRASSSS